MSRDALIVGINSYVHLDSLEAPAEDAEAIAQMLTVQGGSDNPWRIHKRPEIPGDGTTSKVAKTIDVPLTQLEADLERLFLPTGEQIPETALFYFSGHGLVKETGLQEGFLATSDANPDQGFRGLSLQWLRRLLEKSPIRQQVVLLDCCHAGAFLSLTEANPGEGAGKSRCFITASRDFEPAHEDLGSDHSVLAKALLEGLDASRTGRVTSISLFNHVNEVLKGMIQAPIGSCSGEPILLTTQAGVVDATSFTPTLRSPVPLQMPSLPEHFVERPDQEQALKKKLLCSDNKVGTLVVSAIYGLGGIGKSVLAAKLAHDTQVQTRFSDGILWVTLGQTPDLLPLLGGWIQAMGDYNYKPTGIEAASAHLRTLLYDKKALLVVDDVWQPEHLEPFRVGGSGCCVLVTTREVRIPDAQRHDLDVMSSAQALELLTQKLPEQLSGAAREKALAFADRVGYLPLALDLAATQIKEGVSWNELLEDFQSEVVRLEGLDLYGREDIPDDAKRRRYSLLACFNLSLKQLSSEQLRQFAWLGITPEDVGLTQEMAAMLWQVTPRQSGAILRTFSSKALLVSGVKTQDQKNTYRMHDLMHDLAQRLLSSPPQPPQEEDLPGYGLTKAEAHSQFLERYRAKTQNGQWHTLEDDGYIYAHLTWHMEQAGRPDEVHQLLQEINESGRNGWYEACDYLGKPAIFVNDLGRAWSLASQPQGFEDNPCQTLTLQWRYGLIRASLNSLAGNIPPELIAALVRSGLWSPAQGLAYVQQTQKPDQRAQGIVQLTPYLPQALIPEALETTRQIRSESACAMALRALASNLPKLWPETLKVTNQIRNEYDRALALSEMAPHLPELWPEALKTTRQIRSEYDRALALSEMAPHLPEALIPEAFEVMHQIKDELARSIALSEIIPNLPEVLMPEAFEITCQIRDEYYRVWALSALASKLPELMPEALDATRQIGDEDNRARALIALAPNLPQALTPQALETTRQIQSESSRASALSALAPKLPELWPEALETTHQIENEYDRVRALSTLASSFPELWSEALETTRQIQSESSRAMALSALAPNSPKALVPEVLGLTSQIQDEFFRTSAVRALARNLPEVLMPEALELTRQIRDEFSRASAVRALARNLPELWPETLEITRQIGDEYDRARALSTLAPSFPELWPEVLKIMYQIGDEHDRANALSELAPNLPETLIPEALEITRQINDELAKAQAVRALAPHLPEALMTEALEIASQIRDESNRADALIALAPSFPELWPEVLEIMHQIEDEHDRANALCELAPNLPEALMTEALEIASQIEDEPNRVMMLGALAPHLPKLWPEVLETASQIEDESDRANALLTLVPHLPELWPEALETTSQIADGFDRAWTLSKLAPYLPEALMPEALEIARQIRDESDRADALSALGPHLPETLLTEALEATCQLGDKYLRAEGLSGFLTRLTLLNLDFALWSETIDTLAYRNRKEFIGYLSNIREAAVLLAGEDVIPGMVQVMREVCQQWS